jgi:hypothetical protein
MLERQDSWKLPLEEASALGLRRDAETGSMQLLAVDDERYAVTVAAVAHGDIAPPAEAEDVEAAIKSGAGEGGRGSDFEGVASEAGGRVFVLQEGTDRVRVLSPDLRKAPQTIALSVPRDEPDFGEQWHADDNARGEGLLPLRNGHLLVAKQRKEPRLIEFGPPTHEPGGFRPGRALRVDESFPLPAGETVPFAVLASWPLDADTELESINDLAIDLDGRLHAVSSKSRTLARLDGDLDPRGGTAALTAWGLPDDLFAGEDDKAEGLIFAPQVGWLIALDLERDATNLFQITGVPE